MQNAFRIGNVQKTKSKIKTRCYHVFYDSKNYLIADSYVVDKNCNDALDHLNSATDNQSPFTTVSNVTTTNSFRCVRKSLYEAIQTVIERWGGHLTRNNFTIGIRANIGQDNGVTVRYAKNLKDIVVIATDAGSSKKAYKYSKYFDCPMALIDKQRATNNDTVVATNIIGDVKGKTALIFDDEISTAGTLVEAASIVHKHGAKEIYAGATHGILVGPAIERIKNSPIQLSERELEVAIMLVVYSGLRMQE
mgnify:CR=1 FL=1